MECKYHCRGCGRHFRSLRAFDKHRQGEHEGNGRHCVEPSGSTAKGVCRIAGPKVEKGAVVYG